MERKKEQLVFQRRRTKERKIKNLIGLIIIVFSFVSTVLWFIPEGLSGESISEITIKDGKLKIVFKATGKVFDQYSVIFSARELAEILLEAEKLTYAGEAYIIESNAWVKFKNSDIMDSIDGYLKIKFRNFLNYPVWISKENIIYYLRESLMEETYKIQRQKIEETAEERWKKQ